MDYLLSIVDFILHIDQHLSEFSRNYHQWLYLILFVIVFCETGLVVTPFLPGDSLLFAAGALAALPESGLSIYLLAGLLMLAAISGDFANYWIGQRFGIILTSKWGRFVKKEYIEKTEHFFSKHGNKTIVIARFLPIVRTFAPFVAGIGSMSFKSFARYNVAGGFLWTILFLFAGFLFGNIPAVKNQFSLVVLMIIILSVLPILFGYLKTKFSKVKPE